jgi:hypothetical protein
MVDQTLLKYIVKNLSAGYSMQEIKNFLIQNGYDERVIEECQNYLCSSNLNQHYDARQHKKHIIPLVVISCVFIAIIAFIFATVFLEPTELLSGLNVDVVLEKQSFTQDEIISFTRHIQNTGQSEEMDVEMTYTVKDARGNEIYSTLESTTIETDSSEQIVLDLPRLEQGTYFLHATASFDGGNKTKTTTFAILNQTTPVTAKGNCFDGVRNQNEEGIDCGGPCKPCIKQCPIFFDDNDPCTEDKCGVETNYKPVHEDIVPCCGNFVCETGEDDETCSQDCQAGTSSYFNGSVEPYIDNHDMPLTEKIEEIKKIAEKDVNRAGNLCAAIVFDYYKDQCFYEISEAAQQESLCANIQEERTRDKCYTKISKLNEDVDACSQIESGLRRDSCYMRFALKGDFSVCSKIEDDYYKQSCEDLSQVSDSAPEAIVEYSTEII